MSSFHPTQRLVPCRFLTTAGWIEGSLHLPTKWGLLEYLNRGDPFFRLTGAKLPGQREVSGFFALARDAVHAAHPLGPDERLSAAVPGHLTSHRTLWLLPSGDVIDALVDLHDDVRVSDHLVHRTGFVLLRDCTLFLQRGGEATVVEPGIEQLALQASHAVGASELLERT